MVLSSGVCRLFSLGPESTRAYSPEPLPGFGGDPALLCFLRSLGYPGPPSRPLCVDEPSPSLSCEVCRAVGTHCVAVKTAAMQLKKQKPCLLCGCWLGSPPQCVQWAAAFLPIPSVGFSHFLFSIAKPLTQLKGGKKICSVQMLTPPAAHPNEQPVTGGHILLCPFLLPLCPPPGIRQKQVPLCTQMALP